MQSDKWSSVTILQQSTQLKALMTIIRNDQTSRSDFIFHSDRIIRMLVEEGLNHLPTRSRTVITPIGSEFEGSTFVGKICGVSIMRAGESMEQGLREVCKGVRIGKILIQRDEETAQPKLYYSKLPQDISSRYVLLLDPMLATGGSAAKAIDVLKANNVNEERILFLNLIAAPQGIEKIISQFPNVKIITAQIDNGLDDQKFIVPGLGNLN